MTMLSQHASRDPQTGLVPQQFAADPGDAGWGDGVSIIDVGVECVGYHDAVIASVTVAASRAQSLPDWTGIVTPGSLMTADRKWFAVRPGELVSDLAPQIVDWFVERGIVEQYAEHLVGVELARNATEEAVSIARATAIKIAAACPGSVDTMLAAVKQAANELGSPALSERRRRFDEARTLAAVFVKAHGPNSIADLVTALAELRH